MPIENISTAPSRQTPQPTFTIAQGRMPEFDARKNLMQQMQEILASQNNTFNMTLTGQRQSNNTFNTSVVYDTSIGSEPHRLGKVAISVTKTEAGWKGKFQLYPGNGSPPKVLEYVPTPFSPGGRPQSSADFATEMVRALNDNRFDLFFKP